ncbi:uncharacterized protein KGF55_003717 [Candida pseudojiufengensis]|uniref:uncharacterized protein n=1 Tax=Candida pseudojiufengensis TaxID=497109 RepID=UPI0022249387|nr:uncharacterized protein KGF55_003717 [Candida pseudojiufengensis]KAI5962641.1 hypothetical protein KGF55_003717 [Candida pseudojiufengensis]
MELFSQTIDQSFATTKELNDINQKLISNEVVDKKDISNVKKRFILSSVKLQRSIQNLKDIENESKKNFIKKDITNYNKLVSEVAKANQNLAETTISYEKLASTVKMPDFTINIKTIRKFHNEDLIKISEKIISADESVKNIKLNQLFALNSNNDENDLIFPDIQLLHDLINLEFQEKIKKRVMLEILSLIKVKLEKETRSWIQQDSLLKHFLNVKVKEVIEKVELLKSTDEKEKEEEEEDEEEVDEREDENRRTREDQETEYLSEEEASVEDDLNESRLSGDDAEVVEIVSEEEEIQDESELLEKELQPEQSYEGEEVEEGVEKDEEVEEEDDDDNDDDDDDVMMLDN